MDPTPDSRARLVALVNEIDESDRLVELLDPCDKNSFARPAVETILAAKKSRSEKQFSDFSQIRDLFVDKKQADSLTESLEHKPCISHPVLLLPVRLETRFTPDHLLVRIYPDQVCIHSHEESLSRAEYEAARRFREASEEDPRTAWRVLSSKLGPTRAAFVAKWSKGHKFKTDRRERYKESQFRMPRLEALPDKYWIYAYRYRPHSKYLELIEGTPVPTKPVRAEATVMRQLGANADGTGDNEQGLFDQHSKWMHDFNAALEYGFAVKIPLTPVDLDLGFDRIVAVGMKFTSAEQGKDTLEGLLDAHHYSSGLGFVTPGTATNNTNEAKSPFSSREDHDSAYEIEIEGPSNWEEQSAEDEPRTNAHRLSAALGIDPKCLRDIEGAGSVGDAYAAEMNTILWTVTGDYYLRYLLPDLVNAEQLANLRTHVREFVRGGGPLPTLRIGRQPYGVLPVTAPLTDSRSGGWLPWWGDKAASSLDPLLHIIVALFGRAWLEHAQDSRRVPRVGVPGEDPDETLLRILSMEPHSVSYRARPFVDERFIASLLAVLRDYAFGPDSAYADSGLTPLQWMAKWSDAWESVQKEIAGLLVDLLSGLPVDGAKPGAEEILDKPLMNIMAWWEGRDEPANMVWATEPEGKPPPQYLAELCETSDTTADTLLAKMACRALTLAQQQDEESNGQPKREEEIEKALCALASHSALSFFNTVTKPEQIVDRIKDDPAVHPERRGYGINHRAAEEILRTREKHDGKFRSVWDVFEAKYVGPDSRHDILFSFIEDKEQLNIDRLFRESLDLASHRVDAWVTSFAYKRLRGLRELESDPSDTNVSTETGIHIGAYGFVEDLVPRDEDTLSEGYIHAPSTNHAAAAAVLYNAFLTHDPALTRDGEADNRTVNPFHINLTSERVRHGRRILEGIRQGQPLGALLGYQFERALQDHAQPLDQYIHEFRESFPLVAHKVTSKDEGDIDANGAQEVVSAEAVAARNVVDGVALIRACALTGDSHAIAPVLQSVGVHDEHKPGVTTVIQALADRMDAIGDLLVTESVYHGVQGNYERAGAAMEAASGNLPPPELESVSTPVSGRSFTHRVGLVFNKELSASKGSPPSDPRGVAEPRIAAWFENLLGGGMKEIGGPMKDIGATFDFSETESDPDKPARVNVNTALPEQLARLGPINELLAQKIIDERESEQIDRGPFKRLADLTRVNGIGPATVEELRPLATTGVNTVGLEELGLSTTDFLYIAQFPAEGAETELEQRLKRFVRDEFGLPAIQSVTLDTSQSGDHLNSVDNAIELARSALDLLAAGRPMTSNSLCHPGDVESSGYCEDDVKELRVRVDRTHGWISALLMNVTVKSRVRLTVKVHAMMMQELRIPPRVVITHVPTATDWQIEREVVIHTDGTGSGYATHSNTTPLIISSSSEWVPKSDSIPELLELSIVIQSIDESEIVSFDAGFLENATRFGVTGAVPASSQEELSVRAERFLNAYQELRRRHAECGRLLRELDRRQGVHGDSGENANSRVKKLRQAMKILFGKSFVVLPTCVPQQQKEQDHVEASHEGKVAKSALNDALEQYTDLNALDNPRLRLWLQQAAAVREPVAKLEDILMMAEAWSQSVNLHLSVSQLPYTPNRNWLGLSIEEGAEAEGEAEKKSEEGEAEKKSEEGEAEKKSEEGEAEKKRWARSPLSLVLATHGDMPKFAIEPKEGNRPVIAGIMLDEWEELIPSTTVNTSVAYHYDAPNTQAPQSLLLAVAPKLPSYGDGGANVFTGLLEHMWQWWWTHDGLARIVNDTVDLAKVRAVDLDALAVDPNRSPDKQAEPIGGIMPGIFLPTDPNRPGWERTVIHDTVDDWILSLAEKRTITFDDFAVGELENGLDVLVDNEIYRFSPLPEGLFRIDGHGESYTSGISWKALSTNGWILELPRPAIAVDLSLASGPYLPDGSVPDTIRAFNEAGEQVLDLGDVGIGVTQKLPHEGPVEYVSFISYRLKGTNIRRVEIQDTWSFWLLHVHVIYL